MAKLTDLINGLREVGGEYPETLLDDVSTAYADDISIYDGKVEHIETENAALKAENIALKAANHDLIMAGSREPGAENDPEPEPESNGDDDENVTIEELYDN